MRRHSRKQLIVTWNLFCDCAKGLCSYLSRWNTTLTSMVYKLLCWEGLHKLIYYNTPQKQENHAIYTDQISIFSQTNDKHILRNSNTVDQWKLMFVKFCAAYCVPMDVEYVPKGHCRHWGPLVASALMCCSQSFKYWRYCLVLFTKQLKNGRLVYHNF